MNGNADPVTNADRVTRADRVLLGLMTKFWEPGKVKTRLGQTIGMPQAAALHRLFVCHLCRQLVQSGDHRVVSLSPDGSADRFERELDAWRLGEHWKTMPQGKGDLGQRMHRWFQTVLSGPENPSCAILLGADCPTIDAKVVADAAARLSTHNVVVGPANDGGYYLIGLRGPWQPERHGPLFCQMPWSSDRVLVETRSRIEAANLQLAELETREDIDTERELDNLLEYSSHQLPTELIQSIHRVLGRSSRSKGPCA